MSKEVAWDLTSFFRSLENPKIDETLEKVTDNVIKLKEYKGRIFSPEMQPEELLQILQANEQLIESLEIVDTFACLFVSADQTNAQAQSLRNKVQVSVTDSKKELSFIELEFGELLSERKEEFMNSEVLSNYAHFFEKIDREHPHKLSEIEEQLILEKDQWGVQEWRKLQSHWLSIGRVCHC